MYSPNSGFVGTDSFTYRICDTTSTCSGFATVALNVSNNAPTPGNDSFTVHGLTQLGNLLVNDTDPDGDPISFNSIVTQPQHGHLQNPNLQFPAYSPNVGYTGPDSFTYRICDNLGFCADSTVTLNVVNNPPTPVDKSFTVRGTTQLGNLLTNDTDPDSDPIFFDSIVTQPLHGILQNPNLQFPAYSPNPGYAGTDSFTYRVCDNLGLCSIATVSLLVLPNDGLEDCGTGSCQSEVLTATDAMNGVTTNTYDAAGSLLSVTDALNNSTTFTYDARGELLIMTNALGKVTTLTWDTSGRLTQVKDALNNTTTFAYDARARLTSATNALNFITSYAYDAAGRVNKITRPDNTFITFTYDVAGRRTKVTDALNNSTSFAYDGAYRLTGQTDALGKSVSYTYDLMSNLTAATDQLAHTTNIDYDDFNRPIKTTYPPAVAGGTRLLETVEYDAVGNVTKRTDTAGRVTTFTYDNANRLVTVTDPALQVTQYEYNPRSNVTVVVDALSQRYEFGYDALSHVTSATRAGMMMSFAYDAVGNRIQRTDYNNLTTNYTYDALNRLTNITYPDASAASYVYDALSQLKTATNLNGTVSFVYDSLGRATSTTDVWGQVLNYTYDANDRRTTLSFGATTNATYTYDVVNRLTKITDSGNLAVTFAYDAAGRLTSKTLPNGVAATYTYDDLDRLTRLKDAKGNTLITDNNYTYNTAGDITQNIDQSGTHAYAYDSLDRLTAATYTGTPNETYAYDGVGNRTSSHKSATYGYQPFNRLVNTASASYIYDNNDNMISKSDASGTTQFAWDFENRLTQVVTPASGNVTYKYDALGRRIQRTPSSGVSTNFIYDGQDVVKDINSDGTTVEYLNGPGIDNKIRQKGSSNSTTYYFSQDHLGSTTALTGTTGKLVERQTDDAYGNSAGSTRTRYGFTGRERDSLAGLTYYRARWYDAQLGRFISADPIGLKGGVNLYSYTENDPVNAIDPFGQDVIAIFDRRKGTLTVTDRQTGKRMVIKRVFSGYRGCSNNPSCDAVKDTGPVPTGNYLIGNSYVPQKHQGQSGDYNWYRLYGSNGRGGYSYTEVPVRDANGKTVIRGGFNLHTGSYSEGCLTVESDTSWWSPFTTYPQSDAYTQLRQMLDNTAPLTYKGSTYRGRLIVK